MPKAQSKRQQAKFFAMEARGEVKKGFAKRHARKGAAFKSLPAKKRKKR
jgi:hypothetical protein